MIKYGLQVSSSRAFSGIFVTRTTIVDGENKEEFLYFRGANKVYCGTMNDNLFDFLNMFLETLSPDTEKKHWEWLKEAKRVIEPGYFDEPETEDITRLRANNLDYKFLCDELYPIFLGMYNNIKASDIEYAAEVSGALKPPSDLNETTRQGDYPEETTINDVKYKKLAGLALITELALPVYNQLVDHLDKITGSDYRYAVVGDMFCRLPCIMNHPGYAVLSVYISSSLKRHEGKRAHVGVESVVKLTDGLINKGVLSKLALTFVPSKMAGKNLSNELSSLVTGEIRPNGKVKIKSLKDDQNGTKSLQEAPNIAQETNASDELALGEYFTFDLIIETSPGVYTKKESGFFKYQCIGLGIKNQGLAERIYNTLPANRVFHLTDSHIKLLQLVYQDDIPRNLYLTLDYDQLTCALVLAQVKLYELGFEQLAIFVMCVKHMTDSIPHLDDASKLNTTDKNFLGSICKHFETIKGALTDNSAVLSAAEFLEEVISAEWKSNIEEGLLGNEKFVSLMASNHEYEVSFDTRIKTELLELIKYRNS